MKVDEMIESIEVVKGGHVTHMVVQGMDGRVEKYVFPLDSVPPSMIVANRKALVEKLEAMIDENAGMRSLLDENAGMRALLDHQDAELRDLRQPNLPLTFEQLKERVGKPVYRKHKDGKGVWMILVSTKESITAACRLQALSFAGIFPTIDALGGDYEYYDHETEKGI